jgi:hypothetical protein
MPTFTGRRVPARSQNTTVWKFDAGTAVHEAGHAVAAVVFGWEVVRVCVADPSGDVAGRCEVLLPEPATPRKWIAFLLAGAVAEQTLTDRSGPWGDGQDRREAQEAALEAAGGNRTVAAKILADAEEYARELVIAHAAEIRTLAAAVREVPGVGLGQVEVLAALGRCTDENRSQ